LSGRHRSNDIETFLRDNQALLARTRLTHLFIESHGSRTFEYPVPSSHTFTTTTITLSPSPSDHPSLEPDTRNNLIIEVTGPVSELHGDSRHTIARRGGGRLHHSFSRGMTMATMRPYDYQLECSRDRSMRRKGPCPV
jgi:hypothetical protein